MDLQPLVSWNVFPPNYLASLLSMLLFRFPHIHSLVVIVNWIIVLLILVWTLLWLKCGC